MAQPEIKKRLIHGSTLGAGVVLALALLLIVNYFGWKYHARGDWTEAKIYSLSEKSLNVLASLEVPIQVVVFLNPGSEIYDPMRELLAQYEAASPRITVRFMDPVRNLLEAQRLAEEYELTNDNVVVVASESDKRVLLEADLAELDFSGVQFGGAPTLGGFKGEQEVTGAILELAEDRKPKLLFTTGHGERGIPDPGPQGFSLARELLASDNVDIDEWASLGEEAVPEGTDVVVVAGPTGTFVEPELAVLDAYLESGGRILVLLDPAFGPAGGFASTGLEGWLAGRGVEVGANVAIDPASSLPFFSAETLFVSSYGSHTTTRTVQDRDLPTVVSAARSVAAAGDGGDLEPRELLFTSAEGWGEVDLDAIEVSRGDDDLAGPVPLGVVVEWEEAADGGDELLSVVDEETADASEGEDAGDAGEDAEGEGLGEAEATEPEAPATPRLVVFGDSDFAANRLLQGNAGNQVLLFDTVNWLVEREALLGIPAKEPEQVRLNLNRQEVLWLWVLALLVLPGAAIVAGVAVYFRRRR